MSTTKGSIVVDEIIIPIVDIYLDNAMIYFVGTLYGPVSAAKSDHYVINDRSGVTVFRSSGVGHVSIEWIAVGPGERLTVIAPIVAFDRVATYIGDTA